ncbi:extracellular solute-binding protein [Paenibacillus sacheonensis]|uniref:Extracellular solute-binding protein n=1 Tax=Paenibacillus sacheonensis TaxID=742054 RepID=A0A7X4YNG7_9BACL|nr:extracellular solute-binding protein [Paenibacillus sacheonensis]MBM7565531.1 putative aldouronate transport system substrate-binding protein [Paenibacillus sacheonensis]NBC69548.1 extracellular solute-binding protein [Paenibacillus sacheonensis]
MKHSRKLAMLALILILALVTACSKSNDNGSGSGTSNGNADGSTAAENDGKAAGDAAPADINAKYDPPITVTAVRDQDASITFKQGEDFDANNWTKAYQDELGITVKHNWIVPSDQYNAKLNIAIASGDLPDIFKVNGSQLKQLVDAGMLADLTDVYEKYASDLTKNAIDSGPLAKAAATFDGKLMAIPPDESGYEGGLNLLYLRSDWLQKLNLKTPTTWAELENVMDAFVNQDPDGNGKKDTFGLALTKDLYKNGVAESTGVFNAFGSHPNIWIEGADGQIVYGGIQQETRTALAKLQEMYKKGWIDPEFGVKDSGKVGEDFANNKVGVDYGALWDPLWPLQDTVTKNPNADWSVSPAVSATDKPLQYSADLSFNEFMVVNKNMKNPEAVIKLMNFGNDKLFGGKADPKVFHSEKIGDKQYDYFKENVIRVAGSNPIGGNFGHYKKVTAALSANDPSGLNPEQKDYYDKIVAYNGGDRTAWGTMRVFGPESAYSTIEGVYQNKEQNLKFTKFYGAPTKTMAAKKSTLDKMQLETFTKIILGSPIEDFDKFVADWKKLGGDQMTQEVNEWSAQQGK